MAKDVFQGLFNERALHREVSFNKSYHSAGLWWYRANNIHGGVKAVDPTKPKVDGGLAPDHAHLANGKIINLSKEGKRWRAAIGTTLSEVLDLVILDNKKIKAVAVILFEKSNTPNDARTRERLSRALEQLVPQILISGTSLEE